MFGGSSPSSVMTASSSDLTDQLMEKAKLAVSGRAPVITSRFSVIVTPELERSTDWIRSLSLSLYKSGVKVSGYRLFLVEEWLDDSPFLYSSVMVPTGRSSDQVMCNVLRMTATSTPEQHRIVQDNFMQPLFNGLTIGAVESNGHKLGEMVVCDPDQFVNAHGQPMHLIEVVHGSLQGEAVVNARLALALRLFNCLSVSARLTTATPSKECAERFDQMYRPFLQGTIKGGADNNSFRYLVRRLVRRIMGALTNLLYRSGDVDPQGLISKEFMRVLDRYRAGQPHQSLGVTPEFVRKLRGEVDALARALNEHGFAAPSDPWSEYLRMNAAVTSACAQFGIFPDRSSFPSLMEHLEKETPSFRGQRSRSSLSVEDFAASSPAPTPLPTRLVVPKPIEASSASEPGPDSMRGSQGIGSSKLMQLKEATEVLDTVISQQREEIARSQASYDALYERYTAVTTKMYEALQELNMYKLRVEDLEGQCKQLEHSWTTTTEAIREYNDTFSQFEGRVLRLDEHVNNMYRQSKGLLTRFGFWVLTWIIWLVGTIFGYGVSFVYFFRRGDGSEQAALKKRVEKELSGVLHSVDPDLTDRKEK